MARRRKGRKPNEVALSRGLSRFQCVPRSQGQSQGHRMELREVERDRQTKYFLLLRTRYSSQPHRNLVPSNQELSYWLEAGLTDARPGDKSTNTHLGWASWYGYGVYFVDGPSARVDMCWVVRAYRNSHTACRRLFRLCRAGTHGGDDSFIACPHWEGRWRRRRPSPRRRPRWPSCTGSRRRCPGPWPRRPSCTCRAPSCR